MLYNRDLSWLDFNHRVLQEAIDEEVPLYERLRFLAIFSSNLDEFFRVRYPAVMAFSKLDKKLVKQESLKDQVEVSKKIQKQINKQLNEFGDILLNKLMPALRKEKIRLYYNEPINPVHFDQIREIFLSQVLSFIQPVFLGTESAYNFLPENNKLYLLVTLLNKNKDTISQVTVNIPSEKLNRFFDLDPIDDVRQVVFIDDIVRENLQLLFPGQDIQSVYSIKFNRDAELVLDEVYSEKLLEKIEKQLAKRDVAATSRFLFQTGMPSNLQLFLSSLFGIKVDDMFEGGGYHNLSDLFKFPVFDDHLLYPKLIPILYPTLKADGDIFEIIHQHDILVHLPYHAYTPVLTFFNQAAVDPEVTEIYITLYRVAAESHIVNALISAAKNGKKVTTFIELKARFDEANNIKWSREMKQAGVKLIYSDPKIKVHSKIALVKKMRDGETLSYATVCTGNFNESTASFYTDHVLMTADKKICDELDLLFGVLQKKKVDVDKTKINFDTLYVSRFNLVSEFEKLIQKEIKKQEKTGNGLIRIKVNNLEEPEFIQLLYKASQAGVTIQLMVRSICCLIPGKAGISDHITVRRIVGRFLEHPRLFIFGENDDAVVLMGSSDLMTRNLKYRIEVCVKIKDKLCRQQLLDYFEIQWSDTVKATELDYKMEQKRMEPGENPVNAQKAIYQYLQKN